jgi:glyoxylase-like metal-dependent hydrolase (beta-lactamase superfamily II)
MTLRRLTAPLCLAALAAAAWVGTRGAADRAAAPAWAEVAPGVFRSPGFPAGYALVAGDKALLIDAPAAACEFRPPGVKRVDAVLLTHHHRDTAAAAGRFLADGVPVRAPRASAEWLTPDNVRKHWQVALPLRNSYANYLVLPEGLDGIDCSLADGQAIDWGGWSLLVVATPGHSRDHIAYAARRGAGGPLLVFCGDALASAGKVWTPYTTDWDHWTEAGLKPAGESLRKLAALDSAVLLPAHGDVIARDAARAVSQTAAAVEEVAFLKSFERYTKERLKDAPQYAFLAKEQAKSNGSLPWSRVSEHLFLTGNTYVLVSKDDRAFLVVDPWDPHSARQIPKLKADQGLGKMEVVLTSHAHWDHYNGVYSLPARGRFEIWALDRVAEPIGEPFRYLAPFLEPEPVRIDRRPRDGDTLTWREYRFRFHHLPGQTEFTSGFETVIDGKRCFFTADNFFHQDQFSGTGGWMGLNRSWPLPYAASARKVLDAAPEWVLAEHGGPFEFSAEDFRRRVRWGEECARAADALSPSGSHRRDWDPHRAHVEPVLQKAKPGATVKATLVASNVLAKPEKLTAVLEGRGRTPDQTFTLDVPAGGSVRKELTLALRDNLPAGRHVFALRVTGGGGAEEGTDAFVAVDVAP